MHPTAMTNSKQFFDCYGPQLASDAAVKVIEIGSRDVNGSIRKNCPAAFEYIGVDFEPGKGVDLVLADPYVLPFADGSADAVVSSSCFEHSEMFWILFLEILRILKPAGLFYLNAPSNGGFHRYPVDCWRFYPDSGRALVSWARRNGVRAVLLESYTSTQIGDKWNDFVGVFLKDEAHLARYPRRILDSKEDFNNGLTERSEEFLRFSPMPEDQKKMQVITEIINNKFKLV
ncbi:MAG: class I SAM-dependent methyltransferase [Burkholderiaceae bacterium]|nr:class I SAM-dependent methyltransferase [Burkholderiaceae bacterium]